MGGDGGGYALTSSRSVFEGVPTPGPTMDTASGCGKTVGGYRIGVRYDGVVCRGRRMWRTRVEATPGFIPELLRLTVSPLSALLPGWSREAICWEVGFPRVPPHGATKAQWWRQLPAYTWWLNHGRRRFWLFTRTPVEWDAFRRPSKDAFATGIRLVSRGVPPNSSPGDHTLTYSL